MANMTFKANLLPNTDLGYSLGSSSLRWKLFGKLESIELNSTTLNNTAGNFFFKGSGDPWTGTDWVGIQVDSGVDKFQLSMQDNSHIMVRQNDSGGTNTSWGNWQTYVNRAGDVMSGRLQIKIASSWSGVQATQDTTGINLDLENNPNGRHGLWSSGYWNGSTYTENSRWIIYRNTDNRCYIGGPLTIDSSEDVDANNANGALIIGNAAGINIGIDNNEIIARNNSTVSSLYIQSGGGTTYFGGNAYPSPTNTYNLGTASYVWDRVYTNGLTTDNTITIKANTNNEINFGGTNNGTTIYFGYRATDSRPVPTKFTFGSSTGTADLQCKTVYLGSGTSSYVSSTYYTGNAASANKIKYATTLTTKAQVDAFREAGMLQVAGQNAIDYADSGDLSANDGIIMSIPWVNTNWGHQMFFDDSSYLICHRFRSNNDSGGYWNKWIKLLDTSNYSGVLDSRYVTLSTDQTITGKKTFKNVIIAYNYGNSNSLPAITMDKLGSHAVGIGPDGTSNRIKFGPCDLAGTAWVAQGTFNSNEFYFQGKITTSYTVEAPYGIITNHGNKMIHNTNEINFIPNGYNNTFWFNYQDYDRTSTAEITRYKMGNGKSGLAELEATKVYGAVWNDIAETRKCKVQEPGVVVIENEDGEMHKCTQVCAAGAKIISDTFGYCMGEITDTKKPIAIAGRVLAKIDCNKKKFKLGQAVCSGKDGGIIPMPFWKKILYPERIIGTVSEIPNYNIWYGGSYEADEKRKAFKGNPIEVNNRIWIYVK